MLALSHRHLPDTTRLDDETETPAPKVRISQQRSDTDDICCGVLEGKA
jgi:hypothetical protein